MCQILTVITGGPMVAGGTRSKFTSKLLTFLPLYQLKYDLGLLLGHRWNGKGKDVFFFQVIHIRKRKKAAALSRIWVCCASKDAQS